VHAAYGHGFVLIWHRCNMICASSVVDEVMFSYSGPYADVLLLLLQNRCNVVLELDESFIEGVPSNY